MISSGWTLSVMFTSSIVQWTSSSAVFFSDELLLYDKRGHVQKIIIISLAHIRVDFVDFDLAGAFLTTVVCNDTYALFSRRSIATSAI